MYLEMYYRNRKPKALQGPASLWGPGATVGVNVVEGRIIVTIGRDGASVGDIIHGYDASTKHCRKLRAAFKALDYQSLNMLSLVVLPFMLGTTSLSATMSIALLLH